MNPVVINGAKAFDGARHLFPPEYAGHFESLMIDANEIRTRVRELAQYIHQDYAGKRPVLICTLKGACPFFIHLSDALQEMRQGYDIEFIRASSYEGTASTGTVTLMGELNMASLEGRHVLIVEDIVDTGTTLASIMPKLIEHGKPATAEVCTLLDKRLDDPRSKKYSAKYCGFSIPNFFIIGYGLDYNELYRDLKDIYIISQQGIDFDATKLHS